MIGNIRVFYNNNLTQEKLEYRIFKSLEYSLPTLRLLSASILVAVSGACRICIGFLFLNIEPDIIIYLAGALVIYATYTLDRSMDCEEDKVNRRELVSANKYIGIFISVTALLTGALLFAYYDLLLIAFFPLFMGFLYSPGVRIGKYNFKLKGNLGVKNLVVALTWGIFIAGIVQHWSCDKIALFSIFSFFTVMSFINTIINDFRDVDGDAIAGLKTLPIQWGEKNTRKIVQTLHHLVHFWILVAISLYYIRPQFLILLICWLAGALYISFLARVADGNETRMRKTMRNILVGGEFILAVCFKIALDKMSDVFVAVS